MINPGSYYTVQGWMITELGLKGNALAVYAIIYGFSQDGASEYAGSSKYLSEWVGCSRRTILSVLADLTEQGHLIKKTINQNGVTFCNYVAAPVQFSQPMQPCAAISYPMQNFHGGCENISGGDVKIFHGGCENISPHNTRDNTRNINIEHKEGEQNAPEPPPPPPEKPKKKEVVRHKYGEYQNVLLTDDQLADLQKLFPNDWQARIERLSEYIASTGKTYKNHYATIKSWARKDRKASFQGWGGQPANIGPNGVPIDPTKTDLDGLFR